jgi:hypothetical protein
VSRVVHRPLEATKSAELSFGSRAVDASRLDASTASSSWPLAPDPRSRPNPYRYACSGGGEEGSYSLYIVLRYIIPIPTPRDHGAGDEHHLPTLTDGSVADDHSTNYETKPRSPLF